MLYNVIVCQSLTHAQKIRSLLDHAGVYAYLIRTPQNLSGRGCSYSVRIPTRYLIRALELLKSELTGSKLKVFGKKQDGKFEEIDYDLF